jgi:hypothetical protein
MADDVVSRIVRGHDREDLADARAALQLLRWLHAEAVFERDRLREHNAALIKLNSAEHDNYAANAAELESELDRERSSRQAWAAEATRLSWINEFNGASCLSDELHPRVCACISDDQAAQLGPGFSRPVCAVHPPHEHVWTACPDCPNRERGPCACSGVPCCDTDRAEIAAGTPWAEGRPPNLTVSEDDAGVFEDDAAVGAEGGEPE